MLTLHHSQPSDEPHQELGRELAAAGSLVVENDRRLRQKVLVNSLAQTAAVKDARSRHIELRVVQDEKRSAFTPFEALLAATLLCL